VQPTDVEAEKPFGPGGAGPWPGSTPSGLMGSLPHFVRRFHLRLLMAWPLAGPIHLTFRGPDFCVAHPRTGGRGEGVRDRSLTHPALQGRGLASFVPLGGLTSSINSADATLELN
jgi:hypothetical protein